MLKLLKAQIICNFITIITVSCCFFKVQIFVNVLKEPIHQLVGIHICLELPSCVQYCRYWCLWNSVWHMTSLWTSNVGIMLGILCSLVFGISENALLCLENYQSMLHEACQITKTKPTVLICIRGKTLPHNFRTIICDLELLSIPKLVNYFSFFESFYRRCLTKIISDIYNHEFKQ